MDSSKPVVIVGFASSSRHQTPFDDQGLEIWTMNHAPLSWIPRWDALFELHTLEHLKRIHAHGTEANAYMEWLGKQPGPGQEGHKPIYTQDAFPEVPASVRMPREELNAWFKAKGGDTKGLWAEDYFTSTVSFMLALAIMQGRPKISLYGVDLLQDEEYSYQRAGCEYLVGFARGMGIPVYVPEQSALCKANYTYGYTEPATSLTSLDPFITFIDDKVTLTGGMVDKAKQDAATFQGALQMADLVLAWMKEEKDVPAEVQKKRVEMINRFKAAETAAISMNAQSEAFKTTVVWAKHFARGGTLKA